ncbi:MAG TPA: LacI family DNA-binding transcriptional regulator [Anaeromyxobacter sp.]|nr:LacI family DNA-binding transcriptional regulator [Anaeromyxobacter sp.]
MPIVRARARPRATITSVARVAGVAVGTVSKHLNGSGPVAVATARRIQQAIDRLGYRVNLSARCLRARRSDSVGLILPNLANPFFAELAHAIQQALTERGLQTLLCESDENPDREGRLLEDLEARQVDGVLFVRASDRSTAAGRLPTIYLDRPVAGRPSVASDNKLGGALVAQHLLSLGHRRLAVLREDRTAVSTGDRVKGFAAALRRRGVNLRDEDVLAGPPCGTAAHVRAVELGRHVQELMRSKAPPTAIFATSDVVAIATARRLLELGFKIPDDVSLVGFDDIEMSAYVFPPLTTVRQDRAAMAREAIGALEQLLSGDEAPPAEALVEPKLVVRASTAPPRMP